MFAATLDPPRRSTRFADLTFHHPGRRARGDAAAVAPASAPRQRSPAAFRADGLILSAPARSRSAGELASSMVVHAIVIAAALKLTAGGANAALQHIRAVEMPFLAKPLLEANKPAPPPPAASEQLVVTNPPPKGFQTIAAVADVPTTIPPVDLSQKALDPRNFSGVGAEGGVANGVVGGVGPVTDLSVSGAVTVYTAAQLDEPVSPLSQPEPVYPKALKEMGVAGAVMLQYIVDTTGRAEPATIRVVSSSNQAFEAPARDAIVHSRFRPARLAGHSVRQLVAQRIAFNIGGDAR